MKLTHGPSIRTAEHAPGWLGSLLLAVLGVSCGLRTPETVFPQNLITREMTLEVLKDHYRTVTETGWVTEFVVETTPPEQWHIDDIQGAEGSIKSGISGRLPLASDKEVNDYSLELIKGLSDKRSFRQRLEEDGTLLSRRVQKKKQYASLYGRKDAVFFVFLLGSYPKEGEVIFYLIESGEKIGNAGYLVRVSCEDGVATLAEKGFVWIE